MTPTPDAAAGGEYSALPSLLRTTLEATLNPLIPVGGPVALIDVPNHDNCGDNAILVGELSYLQQRGTDIRMPADHRSYTPDRLRARLPPSGVIILHGGGNIGASWPNHQRLRRRVLRDFPDRRIVIMPQSIWIHGTEAQQTAADYRGHEQLTLLVRDEASLLAASEKLGVEATLCPDAAFAIERRAPEDRRQGTLLLLRVDGGAVDHPPDSIHSVDWPPERGSDYLRRIAMRLASRAGTSLAAASRFSATLYQTAAERRTEDALRMLDRSELVCTDRLHGCILGILSGVPLVLVPEKTGKLQSFHQTWLADHAGTTMAKDLSDGLRCIATEMSTPGQPAERKGTSATVRKLRDRANSLLMGS